MRWLVGLDLARGSVGALHFAQWLSEHSGDEALGLHALEVPAVAAPEWNEAVGLKVRKLLGNLADEAGMAELPIEIVESNEPVAALEQARSQRGLDAIVVGRRARADEVALVRLGRVARLSARDAHAPVVLCPPELDMTVLDGPVLLATDGTSTTGAGAQRFAAEIAKRCGRKLVALHVAKDVDDYTAASYLKPESLVRVREAMRGEGERLLKAWTVSEGAPGCDQTVVRQGEPVASVLREAAERQACLVVIGSRRLSGVERLFSSSVGLGVAARSRCPVAIVPPDA